MRGGFWPPSIRAGTKTRLARYVTSEYSTKTASSIIVIDDNQGVLPGDPNGYHHTPHHSSHRSSAQRWLVRSRALVLNIRQWTDTRPCPSWTDRVIPRRSSKGQLPNIARYGFASAHRCGHSDLLASKSGAAKSGLRCTRSRADSPSYCRHQGRRLHDRRNAGTDLRVTRGDEAKRQRNRRATNGVCVYSGRS